LSELVDNFYEHLVLSQMGKALEEHDKENDMDFRADVECVALNRLPPRYIRHSVDASFYITTEERAQMDIAVEKAVLEAISFIETHQQSHPDGSRNKQLV